jgi:hypothetical protein
MLEIITPKKRRLGKKKYGSLLHYRLGYGKSNQSKGHLRVRKCVRYRKTTLTLSLGKSTSTSTFKYKKLDLLIYK